MNNQDELAQGPLALKPSRMAHPGGQAKRQKTHFATLVAALEAGRSDALVRYLETASRFHTYSSGISV